MTICFGKLWYHFHLSILWWPKDYPPIENVGNNCWIFELVIGWPESFYKCGKIAFWEPIEMNVWIIEKLEDGGIRTYFKK